MKKPLLLVLLLVCVVLGIFSGYYFFTHQTPKSDAVLNTNNFDKNILYPQEPSNTSIPHSILDGSKDSSSPTQAPIKQSSLPKMAIIMDDMAYPSQLKSLHKLHLKITPSFFPYNLDNKLTPQMAKNEPFYMVHLPLEALHFYQSPHRWIKTGESKEEIRSYIAQIKQDFPKLSFINNHTGSKFSASYPDMKNLIEVLNEYGIEFLDSRTTKDTKAPEIYANMGKILLSRRYFLDNNPDVKAILSQIKKAIKNAQKNGYVIAICHPHKQTFEALQIAKKTLLNQVQLVYISDLYAWMKNNAE